MWKVFQQSAIMNFPFAALPCNDPIWTCTKTQGQTHPLVRVGYLSEQISPSLPPAVIQPSTTITFTPWNTLSKQLNFYSQWFTKPNVDRFKTENQCQAHGDRTVNEDACWNVWYFCYDQSISKKEIWQLTCDWIDGSTEQSRQNILQKYNGKYISSTSFMSLLYLHKDKVNCIYFIHLQVDETSSNFLHSGWCWSPSNILTKPDLILRVSLTYRPKSSYDKIDVNFFIMNHAHASTIYKSKLGSICEWIGKMIQICLLRYNESAPRDRDFGPTTSAVCVSCFLHKSR